MTRLDALVEINPASEGRQGPRSVIAISDIDVFTATAQPRASREESSNLRRARSGDVLLARISPSMENGKVAIVPPLDSGEVLVSSELFVLRPRPGVDPRLIWAYLRRRRVREDLRPFLRGSTGRRRLHADRLAALQVQTPTDRAWAQSVRVLDHLDTARRLRREQVCLLGALPAAAASAGAGAKRVALSSLSVEANTGTNESGSGQGGVPLLGIGNVVEGYIDETDLRYLSRSETKFDLLRPGDVLLVRVNGSLNRIGRCAVYEGTPESCRFTSSLIRIRSKQMDPDFLWAWLQTLEAKDALQSVARSGSGRHRLRVGHVLALPVPFVSSQLEARVGGLARQIRRLRSLCSEQQRLLGDAVESHLSRVFGHRQAFDASVDRPEAENVSPFLPWVLAAASEAQRLLWREIGNQVEGFGLADLAESTSEFASVQRTLALFEQLCLVVREEDEESYRWRQPDAEWEVLG